jgi:hypothetical protein
LDPLLALVTAILPPFGFSSRDNVAPKFSSSTEARESKLKQKEQSSYFPASWFTRHLFAGVNPTNASYNASVVEIYNATITLVHFKNINSFLYFDKTI